MKHNNRSLEETVNARMILMALVSMLLIAAVLIGAFHRRYQELIAENLRACAEILTSGGSSAAMEIPPDSRYRVTLIASDGSVLYDNYADARTQENHLDRSEVHSALLTGEGEAIRKSETLGYNTYYYAVRLADGNVLRVSTEAVSTAALFGNALPFVGLAAFVIVALSVLLSVLFTRQLVCALRDAVTVQPDGSVSEVPYRELVPLAEAVGEQRQQSQQNERIRREFTANVSHELKTPLTSVRGYAEMIESGMAREEDVRVFARRIRDEACRMVTLVHDIVELSELDEERAADGFEVLDLGGVASDAAELLRFSAEQRGVTLSVSVEPASVRGSRTLVEELVYNLCDNAIRYNKPQGGVSVTVQNAPAGPTLTVRDTGIGIPQEHQARIFERFYRVDKSRSRSTGGTGLGLAIVKHVARLHGASIRVESTEGLGTAMTVVFPKV